MVTRPIVFVAPGADNVDPQVLHRGSIHVVEPNLQQDLRFGGRNHHVQKIDGLSEACGDGRSAVGTGEILHSAVQENHVVFVGDLNILTAAFPGQSPAAPRLLWRCWRRMVRSKNNRLPPCCQMIMLVSPVALPFTNTSRGFTASASARSPLRHRNPLDVHRAVDHKRFPHGDEQIARRGRMALLNTGGRCRLHRLHRRHGRGFRRAGRRLRQWRETNSEQATGYGSKQF